MTEKYFLITYKVSHSMVLILTFVIKKWHTISSLMYSDSILYRSLTDKSHSDWVHMEWEFEKFLGRMFYIQCHNEFDVFNG